MVWEQWKANASAQRLPDPAHSSTTVAVSGEMCGALPAWGELIDSDFQAAENHAKLWLNPTWRIRPTARLFSRRKSLIFRRPIGAHGPKLAVVKTYPIPNPAPMCIMGSRYVFALHHAKEKRQGTPLL
jgi:hypothetical protein